MNLEELQTLLKPYIEQVQKLYGNHLTRIVLYGSYARREQRPDSDIDIMIFVDLSEEELKRYQNDLSDITYDFNLDHETDIEPIGKSMEFFNKWAAVYPFYANVRKEWITLYAA